MSLGLFLRQDLNLCPQIVLPFTHSVTLGSDTVCHTAVAASSVLVLRGRCVSVFVLRRRKPVPREVRPLTSPDRDGN